MRNFLDYITFSSGKIGFSLPGFTLGSDGATYYNAFVQTNPILRLTITDASAESVETEIEATGGYRDAGNPLSVIQSIAAVQNSEVYVPVADVFRAALKRPSSISPTPDALCVELTVTVTVYDGTNTELSHTTFRVMAYDAVGCIGHGVEDGRLFGIPDVYRAYRYGFNQITFPLVSFGSSNHIFMRIKSDGTTTAMTYDPDGSSRSFYTAWAQKLALFGYYDDDKQVKMCRVEWIECLRDKILFEWWSPELGGLKSQVADVVASADTVTERNRETVGFDLVDGVEAAISYNVRFPLCTLADYMYFRDILFSNEVYMVRTDNVAYNQMQITHRVAVRVSGNPPAWRIGDCKDLNFTVNIENTKQI